MKCDNLVVTDRSNSSSSEWSEECSVGYKSKVGSVADSSAIMLMGMYDGGAASENGAETARFRSTLGEGKCSFIGYLCILKDQSVIILLPEQSRVVV